MRLRCIFSPSVFLLSQKSTSLVRGEQRWLLYMPRYTSDKIRGAKRGEFSRMGVTAYICAKAKKTGGFGENPAKTIVHALYADNPI